MTGPYMKGRRETTAYFKFSFPRSSLIKWHASFSIKYIFSFLFLEVDTICLHQIVKYLSPLKDTTVPGGRRGRKIYVDVSTDSGTMNIPTQLNSALVNFLVFILHDPLPGWIFLQSNQSKKKSTPKTITR